MFGYIRKAVELKERKSEKARKEAHDQVVTRTTNDIIDNIMLYESVASLSHNSHSHDSSSSHYSSDSSSDSSSSSD